MLRSLVAVSRVRSALRPPALPVFPPAPSRLYTVSPSPLPTPSSPVPALQRPQKHKAKKAKGGKQPSPARQPIDAPLLPLDVRSSHPSLSSAAPRSSRQPDGRVIALSTAESYDTTALLVNLQSSGLLGGAVNLLGTAVLLPRWSPAASTFFDAEVAVGAEAAESPLQETGEVFIFENGTIVLWGLSMNAAETFLRKVIRGGGEGGFVEEGRYVEPETEVLDYWVKKGPTRMHGDAIHLSSPPSSAAPPVLEGSAPAPPSKELLERLAFSAGMAKVTKLGVYEEQFDEFAEGVAGIPKLLQSGSEAPVKKTDIIKRVGTLHAFRQKLNLEDENLLDEPEFLWEDADLHNHYTAICKALEFDSRLTTLNDRVDYAFSLQTTLMELLNAQTSHRLEWIIIILIAFEITLVLIREGVPFLSKDDEGEKIKKAHVAILPSSH